MAQMTGARCGEAAASAGGIGGGGRGGGWSGGDRERPGRGQRVCTMEYNPVCAQRGRDRRTFGNACSADAEGYRIVSPGECSGY